MDTFENNPIPDEETPIPPQENPAEELPVQEIPEEPPVQEAPVYQQIPQQPPQYQQAPQQPQYPPYHNVGTGRKESPYASSPYVMNHNAQQQGYRYQPQTQPPVKPPKKKKSGVGRRILAAVLTIALVASGCVITGFTVSSQMEAKQKASEDALNQRIADLEAQLQALPQASAAPVSLSKPVLTEGATPTDVYAACVDSVVAISCGYTAPGLYGVQEGTSSGSGFILSEDGYVVTNYHVVQDASSITIVLHDGTEYEASLVGGDSSNDLAVLKVDAEGLQPAAIGSSSALNIGDMVVAIGNPLGELASTQTVGYVSGINREVTTDNTIINMIQTDAAINPGNSGGPLFNMQGQVIGITTAKYSGTTGSGASIEGIGFAIPMDDIGGMISDLVEHGYITGAYLGVTVQDTDPESASLYGLPTGAYVVSVVEGGSAHRAGVRAKDIIIGLGDYKVGSITELTRALRNFKAGDETVIQVIRSGKELSLDITLDEKPRDMTVGAAPEEPAMPENGDYDQWYDYFRWYFGE